MSKSTCLFPIALLSIVIVTFILYFPILNDYFISDDYYHVKPLSVKNTLKLFFGGDWSWYRPLVRAKIASEYRLFEKNPLGYHLSLLTIHIINSLLIIWLGWLLFSDKLTAWSAGIIFALHPIQVEGVTWIATQYDAVCTFFVILCLIFMIYYWRVQQRKFLIIGFFSFIAALTSKESAFLIPIFLIFLYWSEHRKTPLSSKSYLKSGVISLLPFFIILILALTNFILRSGAGGSEYPLKDLLSVYSLKRFLGYLELFAYPAMLWILIILIFIPAFRKPKAYIFLAVWFFLPLVLVSNRPLCHRFAYLSAGAFSLALSGWFSLSRNINFRRILMVLLMVLLIFYFIESKSLNSRWSAVAARDHIPSMVQDLNSRYADFPAGSELYFLNLPGRFPPISFLYDNRAASYTFEKYFQKHRAQEILNSGKIFFFEFQKDGLIERKDLKDILAKRAKNLAELENKPLLMVWNTTVEENGFTLSDWQYPQALKVEKQPASMLIQNVSAKEFAISSPILEINPLKICSLTLKMKFGESLDAEKFLSVKTNSSLSKQTYLKISWLSASVLKDDPNLILNLDQAGNFHDYVFDVASSLVWLESYQEGIEQIILNFENVTGNLNLASVKLSSAEIERKFIPRDFPRTEPWNKKNTSKLGALGVFEGKQ